MGPITLFDKSFLQSLSVDESVWFDHFFLINVCPLFYVETLADLDKTVRDGRTPEQEVGIIADKFPDMHAFPCAYHQTECIGELLGYTVPMTGQIPLANGRRVESEGGRAAVFEASPEVDAFARWQRREFLQIEHQYARAWRLNSTSLDIADATDFVKALGILEKCKDLSQARLLAANAVHQLKKPFAWIKFASSLLGVPDKLSQHVLKRWVLSGKPSLSAFVPYNAYVLEVEVFFQIALASKLISSERASNRIDIDYLFYLPFSMMFVSNDRLHLRSAPLFLRPNQEFVWGPDLKKNLGQINQHYLELPESARVEGIYSFATDPPHIGNQVVINLWKKLLPKWRGPENNPPKEAHGRVITAREITRLAEAPEMIPDASDRYSRQLDQVVLVRSVNRKKGSWYQIPKQIEHKRPE